MTKGKQEIRNRLRILFFLSACIRLQREKDMHENGQISEMLT